MHFQKEDLEGTHYNWAEDEKHLFTGQPSRRGFNKFNGDQMLFLINFYGSMLDGFTILEGKSIEKKILFDLPEEAKSEISVVNWIKNMTSPV